jgi:VanZ family protein
MSVGRSRWSAALSTLTIGAIKEVRDRYHPGSTASFRDLAADGAGILIGMLLFSYVAQ